VTMPCPQQRSVVLSLCCHLLICRWRRRRRAMTLDTADCNPDDAGEEDDDDEDGDDDIVCSRSPATTAGAAAVRERQRPHRFASVSTPYPVKIDNFTCDSHFNGSVDLYLMPIRVFNRIVRYSEKSCSRPLLRTVRLSGGRRGHQGGRHVGVPPTLAARHRHGERERMTRFYSNDFRFNNASG
jgi:hypothetical protein